MMLRDAELLEVDGRPDDGRRKLCDDPALGVTRTEIKVNFIVLIVKI